MTIKKPRLSKRKQKYIEGVADGKTKVQAALDAGYSDSIAHSTSQIETPDVRAAFAELIRERIPARKIVQRIDEGLDAMETKFFQKDGEVVEEREVVAWSERRQYAQLAADFGGYFIPAKAQETNINNFVGALNIEIGIVHAQGEN